MSFKTGNDKEPAKYKPANRRKKKIRKKPAAGARKRFTNRLWILLASALVLAVTGTIFFFTVIRQKEEAEPEPNLSEIVEEKEPVPLPEVDMGEDVIGHIVTAGNAVWDAFNRRPESHEITVDTAEDFADITECIIDSSGRISVTAKGEGIPKSDDKYYYLFALNTYDTAISGNNNYVARDYKDNETVLFTSLNYNTSSSRLFKKFVVAVKKDGEYVPVSTPKYITNPEAIARYTSVFQEPASIKGLLVDPNRLRGSELDDLGVKQAAYNIPVARLLGPTTSAAYPSIQYTYKG